MVIYQEGTVFNTDAEAIVNTVNCTGVMSAGIALEYSLRYPEMFKDYEEKCKTKQIQIGKVDYYNNGDVIIVNFPTKWHFKYPSQISWIEQGLKDFVNTYKSQGFKSVAFTKLGTLNGHLNWNEVKQLMEKYLNPLEDIKIYICLDNKKEAEGVEKQMLDILNNTSIEDLKKVMRISSKQETVLKSNLPVNRFWKIKELEGIGITIYSKLHNYCFNIVKQGFDTTQISMF